MAEINTPERQSEWIEAARADFKNKRGRYALAETCSRIFIASHFINNQMDDEGRALLFSQLGVKVDPRARIFQPTIAALAGEFDDSKKPVDAIDGKSYIRWVPDQSMFRYAPLMEQLAYQGFTYMTPHEDIADYIVKNGGCQKLARERVEADKSTQKEASVEDGTDKVRFFEEHAPRVEVVADLAPLSIPADAKEYVSLLARRDGKGGLRIFGVLEKDASSKLLKVAREQYDALKAEQERKAELQRVRDAARREAFEEMARTGQKTALVPNTQELIVSAVQRSHETRDQ